MMKLLLILLVFFYSVDGLICPVGKKPAQLCVNANTKPKPPPPSPAVDSLFATLVNSHNIYRAKHHVPPLTWNPTLASAGNNWVQNCLFQHEPVSSYGENLYAMWGNVNISNVLKIAVDAWYNEINQYDFSKPGFYFTTGHATQLLWKSTTQIGCGIKSCPNAMTLLSCKYNPPGNYGGQFPQNVLPAMF